MRGGAVSLTRFTKMGWMNQDLVVKTFLQLVMSILKIPQEQGTFESHRLCGIPTGGSQECNWDCKLGYQGYVFSNPECLKDCFPTNHCVNRILKDFIEAGGICDKNYSDFYPIAPRKNCKKVLQDLPIGACSKETINKCQSGIKRGGVNGIGRVMDGTINVLWFSLCLGGFLFYIPFDLRRLLQKGTVYVISNLYEFCIE